MDVLKVGEKSYVKASVIARELGYTADYVGQLCRSGKVDAKLFGRSWYVDKDSIQGHKVTRYRSTQALTTKAIKAAQSDDEEDSIKIAINSRFYAHSSLKPSPRYVPDDAELIPAVDKDLKKKGNVQIHLAEAEAVKVSSVSPLYNFETPKLAPIQFKGALEVTDAESAENLLNGEPGRLLHAKEVDALKTEKMANNQVISTKIAKPSEQFLKKINASAPVSEPVVAHRTLEVVSGENQQTEPTVTAIEKPIQNREIASLLPVLVSTFASLAIVVLLVGLETHIAVTAETIVTSYEFTVEDLLASTYTAFDNFK